MRNEESTINSNKFLNVIHFLRRCFFSAVEKYAQELLTNLDQQRRKPAHDALVDLRDRLQLRFEAIHNLLRKNLRREFGRWAERYGAEEPSGPQPSTFAVSPGARFDNFSINS